MDFGQKLSLKALGLTFISLKLLQQSDLTQYLLNL